MQFQATRSNEFIMEKEKEYYIYRYFNNQHDVIYVGLTTRPLKERVREHKVEALQKETAMIDYATVSNQADMEIYEIFYINKYLPKYNIKSADPQRTTVQLPELHFQVFSHLQDNLENVNANYRENSFAAKEGLVQWHVNNQYAKNDNDKEILMKTSGKASFDVISYRKFIEKAIEVLNGVQDTEYELKKNG